ncbi:MAG: alpha/beta fold hydrolase [Sphingomonas sp.]
MIRFLKTRIAAGLFTLGTVLQPNASHAAVIQSAPATAPITQMDHISIEAVGNPKGASVFLIPGLSMSRENWRATADRIKGDYRVYLVQLNGFGGSAAGANAKPGLMTGVVEDLHRYIQANHIQDARIVGHSLGGTLTLLMAKMHPGDLHSVMLVDSLSWVALLAVPPTTTAAQVEPIAAGMRDKIAAKYGQPVDQDAAKATVAALALKPDSRVKAFDWMQGADPRVTAEAYYEDMVLDLRGDLAHIETPVTLLYPHSDAGPAAAAADQLYHSAYAGTPHMTYVPIADSAHFIMLDQPAAFYTALDAFLAK